MKSPRFCCVRKLRYLADRTFLAMVLVLAGTATAANASDKPNVDRTGVILKGCDAVAYVKEGKPIKGKPEIKSSYLGATYLFASAANKAEFDKEPARYAPQYGGFCSYGVSLGVLGDTKDPQAFIVHNGKLHLCGNMASLETFTENIDNNVEKANKQWRRISKL